MAAEKPVKVTQPGSLFCGTKHGHLKVVSQQSMGSSCLKLNYLSSIINIIKEIKLEISTPPPIYWNSLMLVLRLLLNSRKFISFALSDNQIKYF